MGQNFIGCDREQELLLPPSLREWLPEDHLAWYVIDAVAELDLGAFYAAYRADGHGRAAHEPAMMVALLLYAYARGERSSRRIERRCVEDVATRVICANQTPDHTTIARFRQRHEEAIAGLLARCSRSAPRLVLSRSAWSRSTARRFMRTRRITRPATTRRSPRRSSRRPRPLTPRRMSGSASDAATSCRPSCRPRRGGAVGCARRGAA